MENVVTEMRLAVILLRAGFLLYLAVAGWQDYRYRNIRISVFLGFGIAGGFLRGTALILGLQFMEAGGMMVEKGVEAGGWSLVGSALADIGAAMAVGGFLLLLSVAARKAVGQGDGWFFVVSGIYLGFWRNLALLWGSLLLCLLTGGVMLAAGLIDKDKAVNVKKLALPFLTLAVPVGLGVLFL